MVHLYIRLLIFLNITRYTKYRGFYYDYLFFITIKSYPQFLSRYLYIDNTIQYNIIVGRILMILWNSRRWHSSVEYCYWHEHDHVFITEDVLVYSLRVTNRKCLRLTDIRLVLKTLLFTILPLSLSRGPFFFIRTTISKRTRGMIPCMIIMIIIFTLQLAKILFFPIFS